MNKADKMIEITVDEYVQKINEAYERGFNNGVNSAHLYKDKPVSNTPYEPAPYTGIGGPFRWTGPTPDIQYSSDKPSDNDIYEKAPYWLRPGFKMPDVTCDNTSAGNDKW